MKFSLSIVFFLLSLICVGQVESDFNKLFDQYSSTDPGGAIMVLRGEKVVYEHVFGVADIQTKQAIDQHTIFNTGSISKTFVAYGILILEEQGLLSTEDEISKYFPDFKNPDVIKGVKIKHLLTHSSGLPDLRNVFMNQDFFLTAKDKENFDPLKEVVGLKFNPGERFEYSNPAFNGLALIIEKVSKQKWQDFIAEKIFLPAGMTESVITDGAFPDKGVAHAYEKLPNEWIENDYGEFPTFAASGNGGVWCSIKDLVKYEMAIRKNSFLSEEGISKSRSILKYDNWADTYNAPKLGMSWWITEVEHPNNKLGKELVYHTGSQGGFRSFFVSIPEEDILYIALFNTPIETFSSTMQRGLEIIKQYNWFK